METPVLEVKGLTKAHQMESVVVHALRGVDLTLSSGELICLLGPSGSGKSTLLNIIGGLDTPTTGTVRHADQDLTHATEPELTSYRREHVQVERQQTLLRTSAGTPFKLRSAFGSGRRRAALERGHRYRRTGRPLSRPQRRVPCRSRDLGMAGLRSASGSCWQPHSGGRRMVCAHRR